MFIGRPQSTNILYQLITLIFEDLILVYKNVSTIVAITVLIMDDVAGGAGGSGARHRCVLDLSKNLRQ